MLNMDTANQLALLAAYVAMNSELTLVPTDGEERIWPSVCPPLLAREDEQEALDQMVMIACVLVWDNEEIILDQDGNVVASDLIDATLECWAEGTLDD